MRLLQKKTVIVFVAFSVFSLVGVLTSLSAPYHLSNDEIVYLVGVHESRSAGVSPDSYFLQSYTYSWYAYPYILSAGYETFGHNTFKVTLLVVLVFLTGYAAYFLFRFLSVDWLAALILSLGLLLPRMSAGTEFFGVLTFNEAVGRSLAVPLFLVATAYILSFLNKKKNIWPIFLCVGCGMFLHPATVMVFAAAALFATLSTHVYERAPARRIVLDVFLSGFAFVLGGMYMFREVLARLFASMQMDELPGADLYVEAVLFRNAWEFPIATLGWTKHMAIVSAPLVAWIVFSYLYRNTQILKSAYSLPHVNTIIPWGFSMAAGSVAAAFILPGLNLILMDVIDAPYIFQQWSRISKFYYLGIFLLLAPIGHLLFTKIRMEHIHAAKKKAYIAAGVFSLSLVIASSFVFEVTQFAFGYQHFNTGYIPQSLSHVPDDTSPDDFREVCSMLSALGWVESEEVVSGEFAFRYYCKANVYATNEEGAAFLQLPRKDMVDWYVRYMNQRRALNSEDPTKIDQFAKGIGARFVIVPHIPKFEFLLDGSIFEVATTSKHIILKLR